MTKFISKEAWLEGVDGWYITDCAIRSSVIVYIVARQDLADEGLEGMWDHDIRTRVLVMFLDENKNPEGGLGIKELCGFAYPRCGVSRAPFSQGMVVARNVDGDVWAGGSNRQGIAGC